MRKRLLQLSKKSKEDFSTIMKARRDAVGAMGGLESTLEVAVETIKNVDVDNYTAKINDVMEAEDKTSIERLLTSEELFCELLKSLSSKMITRFSRISKLLNEIANQRLELIAELKT